MPRPRISASRSALRVGLPLRLDLAQPLAEVGDPALERGLLLGAHLAAGQDFGRWLDRACDSRPRREAAPRPDSPRGPIERGRTIRDGPRGCQGMRRARQALTRTWQKSPSCSAMRQLDRASRWGQTLLRRSAIAATAQLTRGSTEGLLGISLHVRSRSELLHVKQSPFSASGGDKYLDRGSRYSWRSLR